MNHVASDDQAWTCARCADDFQKPKCGFKGTPVDRFEVVDCSPSELCPDGEFGFTAPLECRSFGLSACDETPFLGTPAAMYQTCANECPGVGPSDLPGIPNAANSVLDWHCLTGTAFLYGLLGGGLGYCDDVGFCAHHRNILDSIQTGEPIEGEAACPG